MVRVTPNDGYTDGTFTDANITIANTPPIISSVTISPSNANTQDTLTCAQSSTDPDGDALSESFAWRINGNLSSSSNNTLTGPFVTGDSIVCEATVADGTDQAHGIITTDHQQRSACNHGPRLYLRQHCIPTIFDGNRLLS